MTGDLRFVTTSMLNLAYEAHGPSDGEPVILLHGFPYDPRGYDAVVPPLLDKGYRIIVPYLRGYGPTRFVSPAVKRSGQQAALAKDLLDLMDALKIKRAALAGYDWGGRAACIVAALWPERVRCLVTADGYNLQNIPASVIPATPETEHRFWYQYYFHTARGKRGLMENRDQLCYLLWRLWSPTWTFDDADFARSAASFDNPDFVDVVIHSYRHRYGYVPGDPALEKLEMQLVQQPNISVPTISLCGKDDGVTAVPPPGEEEEARHFIGSYQRRVLPGVGHNIPQEAPVETVRALLDLLTDG